LLALCLLRMKFVLKIRSAPTFSQMARIPNYASLASNIMTLANKLDIIA
jgi:hypothetical protein